MNHLAQQKQETLCHPLYKHGRGKIRFSAGGKLLPPYDDPPSLTSDKPSTKPSPEKISAPIHYLPYTTSAPAKINTNESISAESQKRANKTGTNFGATFLRQLKQKISSTEFLLGSFPGILVCGAIGFYLLMVIVLTANTSNLVIGLIIGAVLGALYALIIQKDAMRDQPETKKWNKWILQCVVFGLLGGIVGVGLGTSLISTHIATTPLKEPIVAIYPSTVPPVATQPLPAAAPNDTTISGSQNSEIMLQALKAANNALPHAPRRIHTYR
jgi:hypothetical protein